MHYRVKVFLLYNMLDKRTNKAAYIIDFFIPSTALDSFVTKVHIGYGANLFSGAPLQLTWTRSCFG